MRKALILFLPLVVSCANAATFGRVVALVGGATDLALDETRSRLYLTSSVENLVQIYSIQKQAFLTPIGTDQTPLSVALSRDGNSLYVTCYAGSVLDVIDLNALTVTARVTLPAKPEGVAVAADGRVLISTTGSGTTGATNVLLLYDPSPAAATVLTSLSVIPQAPAAPTFPSPSGRPFLSMHSQLVATHDGTFIAGVNAPAAGSPTVFVYESASAQVLRSRAIAGSSTVLAISNDGTRVMSGVNLFDATTLRLLAQQNLANSTYPITPGSSFTTAANQGGAVFSPDGTTVSSAYNITPVQGAAGVTQWMLNDPDNLLIRMGLQIPENLAGKIVMSSDGTNAYALSDSGFVAVPLSTLASSPLAVPATDIALLTNDQCGVTSATSSATVAINNPGKGKISVSAQLLTYAGVAGAPSASTAPSARASSSSIVFSYNSSAKGLGTIAPPHEFLITSPEAVNIPDRIRVSENSRDADARGTIVPIPVGISTTYSLVDLVYDSTRQRVYIANAGLNRVEVYDIASQQLLAPIKVGQLPSSMALTPEGDTLYVANSGGETISMIDPDKMLTIGTIGFPSLTFGSTLAVVTPVLIAAGLSGPQLLMSDGSLWKIVGSAALPRGVSTILGQTNTGAPVKMTTATALAATPGGEYILLTTSTGIAYLYDATLDDYVAGRTVIAGALTGYVGPAIAGPKGQYFVMNGTVLNSALIPQRTISGLVAAVAPVGSNTTFAIFSPPAATAGAAAGTVAPTVPVLDANTGNASAQVNALEGPLTTVAINAKASIGAHTMAVDSSGTTAYVLTATGLSIVSLTPIAPADRPVPTSRGTVNIGSYQTAIAPGTPIAIFGQNLGASQQANSTPLPTVLGGTCVTLNNVALPLFMTSPGQINAQIPPSLAPGSYPLVVRSLTKQAASLSQQITVSKAAPAVLVGANNQILLYHADGSYVNKDNPANRDEPLLMYAVGLGATTGGAVAAGAPSPSSPLAVSTGVSVYFGDPSWVQAGIIVDWSGLAPGMIGIYQLNLRVPGFHISGDALPVLLKVGTIGSPTTGPVLPVVYVN